MDDIVLAAMAKWPKVPHCHGWLALDARGDWYMRDERVQAAGTFAQVKGSRIDHAKLRGFIERNYTVDEHGAWYFQNGPQRVYVELEVAPWVWRLQADGSLCTHTGVVAGAVEATWLDQHGRLFVLCPWVVNRAGPSAKAFGLVHTQDMHQAADALEQGAWPAPLTLPFESLPARFGYRLCPSP